MSQISVPYAVYPQLGAAQQGARTQRPLVHGVAAQGDDGNCNEENFGHQCTFVGWHHDGKKSI